MSKDWTLKLAIGWLLVLLRSFPSYSFGYTKGYKRQPIVGTLGFFIAGWKTGHCLHFRDPFGTDHVNKKK